MIQLENITKSYGSKMVLKGINLDLEKGKVYGIVGENGAGKTTLFKCIAGLEPFEGSLKSEFQPLKNHLGLLETNPAILTRITGWEYLKLLCSARGVEREDFEEQNIFELPLDLYAESYSTGMKKKLAFMAILLQKNEVFILDEPFNGVDIQSNILITELILKLKFLGKTVIISSHIFSTLSDTCDQIFLLKEGSILKSVSKNQFLELENELKNQIRIKSIDLIDLK
jgi:ABC-2 type transport system ATP-binding protein